MWSEWLARTLRPRPAEAAATRAAAPPRRDEDGTDDVHGIDDVRPSTRELALAAQDEERNSLAADV
jgi:hypothetical protein